MATLKQRLEAIENLVGDDVHIYIPSQRQWDDADPVLEVGDDKTKIGKKSQFEHYEIVNPRSFD